MSRPGPAPLVSTHKSLWKVASRPGCSPGPLTLTLLASVRDVTFMLNGVPAPSYILINKLIIGPTRRRWMRAYRVATYRGGNAGILPAIANGTDTYGAGHRNQIIGWAKIAESELH